MSLAKVCSSDGPIIKFDSPLKPNGTNDNGEHSDASKNNTAPIGDKTEPAATFNLRITEPNKIEGCYYSENDDRKKSNWSQSFICETKVGEFAIALFTFFLVVFTARLYWATANLTHAERPILVPIILCCVESGARIWMMALYWITIFKMSDELRPI